MPMEEGGEELRVGAEWFKAHGLGNDYLVFAEGDAWGVSPERVAAICDRTRGVGSDGIIVELPEAEGRYRLRMFNPDGSEFERSGNGLRIFGAALATADRIGTAPFTVEAGGDAVVMQLHGSDPRGILDLSVEMGIAEFTPEAVHLDPGALDGPGRIRAPAPRPLEEPFPNGIPIRTVSIGNPHCVVFHEDLSESLLERVGPWLATHPAFREGTNVQLARVERRNPGGGGVVRILIWERGVGRTSASGTSSCAVAAAAVQEGRLDPGEVELRMPGGILRVHVGEDASIRLRGPVQEVSRGVLSPGFLAFLADGADPGIASR